MKLTNGKRYKPKNINKVGEKEGCDKRQVKHLDRQRPPSKTKRILREEFYKSFRLDRKEDKGIFGGKEITMVNERITEDFVRSHFKNDSMFRNIKFEEQITNHKILKELLKTA